MDKKIVAFDLDDVICYRDSKYEQLGINKYKHCKPNDKMIRIINLLYDDGHIIKIYTARGMTQFSGDIQMIDNCLRQLTTDSLDEWGVKYHELIFGKLHYDILIDDKAINSSSVHDVSDIHAIL